MSDFDIRNQMTEKEQDNALRPLCFDDFAGQSKIVSNLRIFVQAARMRGESLDHVLLFGPPRLGKPTSGKICSRIPATAETSTTISVRRATLP